LRGKLAVIEKLIKAEAIINLVTVLGLYDEFDAEVTCPSCKLEVMVGFQTKALFNLLLYFEVGDKVDTERFIVKDGIIKDALGSCPKCQAFLLGEIIIKDNVFQGVQNIRIEQEVSPVPSDKIKESVSSYLKQKGEAYPSDIADALGISLKEVLAVISILKEEKKVAEA